MPVMDPLPVLNPSPVVGAGSEPDVGVGVPVPGPRLGPAAAGRCRRRIHLDADPTADRSRRRRPDDGTRHRWADAELHRQDTVTRLVTALDPVIGWAPEPAPAPGAADPPRPAVLAPDLAGPDRAGAPELLLWAGDGYLPVVLRNHRTTDPGAGAVLAPLADPLATVVSTDRRPRSQLADLWALAHHYRQLTDLGLAAGRARGAVIGRGPVGPQQRAAGKRPDRIGGAGGPGLAVTDGAAAESDGDRLIWHELSAELLAAYDARMADRAAVAAAAASGAPALAQPSQIGECRHCPWWPVCSVELAARDDVSLIAPGGDADVLRAAGLVTVTALAGASAPLLAGLELPGVAPVAARTRARAFTAGAPLVRRSAAGTVPRADVELDVDMESYLDDGAYLWGSLLSGPGVARLGLSPGYRPFVTWRPLPDADEGRAFGAFWTHLSAVREQAHAAGLSFAAYCYSRQAEERWMRSAPVRFTGLPGVPTVEAVAAFCAGPEWIDLYAHLREGYVITGSLRLKALAPLAGFAWRDPDPGGENSMAWYRGAIGADGPAQPRLAARVLEYNEDDVRATLALRRYLTDRATDLPTVADLDRRWPPDRPASVQEGPAGAGPLSEGPVSAAASATIRPVG